MLRAVLCGLISYLIWALPSTSLAGLAPISPVDSCYRVLQRFVNNSYNGFVFHHQKILINFDQEKNTTYVATSYPANGSFTVFGPKGKRLVKGDNCSTESKPNEPKTNADEFLAKALGNAADELMRQRPITNIIGVTEGSPEAFKEGTENLRNVLDKCSALPNGNEKLVTIAKELNLKLFGKGSAADPGASTKASSDQSGSKN